MQVEEVRQPKTSPSPISSSVGSGGDTSNSECRSLRKSKSGKLRAVVDSVRLLNCSSATANFPNTGFNPDEVPFDPQRHEPCANAGKKNKAKASPELAKNKAMRKRLEIWKGSRRRSASESQLNELLSREHHMEGHEHVDATCQPLDTIGMSRDTGHHAHSIFMAKSHGKPLTLIVVDTSKAAKETAHEDTVQLRDLGQEVDGE